MLENLFFSIADPGAGVLVPTPYYAAFEFDLGARAHLKIVPVRTLSEHALSKERIPAADYYPTKASLEEAYQRSLGEGVDPQVLLLSSPNNPLGVCYPESTILECWEWAESKGIHLVSDEIYGGSVYDDKAPQGGNGTAGDDADVQHRGQTEWVSIATVAARAGRNLGPKCHVVYALSKDYALSGLRVGALYTECEDIFFPMTKMNDLCQVSSHTQAIVAELWKSNSDGVSWSQSVQMINHDRIRQRAHRLTQLLDEHSIPYLTPTAGMFCWMDLRRWLQNGGDDAEREKILYLKLINEFGLLFTPGMSMKNQLPGFFRIVFTATCDKGFEEALARLRVFALSNKSKS